MKQFHLFPALFYLLLCPYLFLNCHTPLSVYQKFAPGSEIDVEALEAEITQEATRQCGVFQQINSFNINGYLINQSGVYCVEQTSPTGITSQTTLTVSGGTGITITANNVILELNDNVINGSGGVTGILILGASGVIIRNGSIATMGTIGINILSSSSSVPKNILISNVTFQGNGVGINLQNAQNCALVNCAVFNSTSNAFAISQSTNLLFSSCFAINNFRGFLLTNNTSVTFQNCQSNNNQNEGFNQTSGIFNLFRQCSAYNNGNTTTVSPGFFITGTTANQSFSTLLLNCFSVLNTGNGFTINGSLHSLDSCFSHENSINGFQFNGNNISVLSCEAKNNTNAGFLLAGAVGGFPISSTCHVRNNLAMNNLIGFQDNGSLNRIYANYANNNFTGVTNTNYVNITNVAVSPTPATPINFTTNISE